MSPTIDILFTSSCIYTAVICITEYHELNSYTWQFLCILNTNINYSRVIYTQTLTGVLNTWKKPVMLLGSPLSRRNSQVTATTKSSLGDLEPWDTLNLSCDVIMAGATFTFWSHNGPLSAERCNQRLGARLNTLRRPALPSPFTRGQLKHGGPTPWICII